MGIFTWIIRASQDELERNVIGLKPKSKDDIYEWTRSENISTFLSDEYIKIDTIQILPVPQPTDEQNDVDEKHEEENLKIKKQKTDDDEASALVDLQKFRTACRLDMDKSWDGIHKLLTSTSSSSLPQSKQQSTKTVGITALLTNTSKNHNKYYEITYVGGGTSSSSSYVTRYGELSTLTASKSSNLSMGYNISSMSSCLELLRTKLVKGYKPRLIGHHEAVQARIGKRGKISTEPVNINDDDTDENENAFVDASKDANVKARLKDTFGYNDDDINQQNDSISINKMIL